MKKATILSATIIMAALAGCMPVPDANVQQASMPVPAAMPFDPLPVPSATGISGLEERKPDLCKAGDYSRHVSQPGSVIPTLGINRDYRVVEYRGIEPQEYDPNRIVFRLDAAGNISNVDCG